MIRMKKINYPPLQRIPLIYVPEDLTYVSQRHWGNIIPIPKMKAVVKNDKGLW